MFASRLETPWRQIFYAGLCLLAPLMLLFYAVGSLYVGIAACAIALVVGILGAPVWLVRLLRWIITLGCNGLARGQAGAASSS